MFKSIKLPNGLKVVLVPLKQTQAVTLLIILPVGSRYENRNNNGVSHFVEHLLFKGTSERPSTIDIAKELDAVGANYNAFTERDHTGYYIKLKSDKVALAFDILADILFNSRFEPQEIESERGVIIEEINMYQDNPLMYIDELFESTIYPHSTLGWDVAGTKKVIKNLPQKAIKNYWQHFYSPDQMILGLAGNFSEPEIKQLLKKHFFLKIKQAKTNYQRFVCQQTKPQLKIFFKETEQIQIRLGFPSLPFSHPDNFPLAILSTILGGNMSSRLFIEVRERHGLAYFIRTGIKTYRDTGNFYIQTGLDRKRIGAAMQVIDNELKKIKEEGVTAEELQRAKEYLKGKIILELENSEAVAEWFVKEKLFRREILTPDQAFIRLKAVSREKVQALAKKLLLKSKLNLAVIGPYKKPDTFRRLIEDIKF